MPRERRVTSTMAAKMIEQQGLNYPAGLVSGLVDRGLYSSGRSITQPKSPRTVSVGVVEQIIKNLRAGKPGNAGFALSKEKQIPLLKKPPKREIKKARAKKAAPRKKAGKISREDRNRTTAKKWLDGRTGAIGPEKQRQIRAAIAENLGLPPKQFQSKVRLRIIRIMSGR